MTIKQIHPAHQDPQYPKAKPMYVNTKPTSGQMKIPGTDGGNQQATEAKK